MVDAISANGAKSGAGAQDLKDKKILDLAKKNRSLQLQIESLKTKAAKAADIALKMKKENEELESNATTSPKKSDPMQTVGGASLMTGGIESEKRAKELEKKVTKLRNENQELKQNLEKAIKCLERETGEIVNLDELVKDDLTWRGRA